MKKLFTAFIFFCCIVAANAQSIALFGKVYSLIDSSALAGVHVINITQQNATTSDVEGYFILDVLPSDKLMFTSIGYESYSLTVPAETEENLSLTVYLEQADYQIDTVTILPYPNKEGFKHAFMNLDLPKENQINLNLPPGSVDPLNPDGKILLPHEVKIKGIGVWGKLFINMDPAHKDVARRQRFEQNKNNWAEIEKKYGNEFIEKLTGLRGEEAIVAFKKFCNLPNDFIIKNNEYVIAEAIVECYKQFEKAH